MKLFWVTTSDGYEDWFVIADSKKEAEEFHELAEGLSDGCAKANYICEITQKVINKYKLKKASWPSHELLRDLGGNVISESNPRKVNFNGRVYSEGTFTEEMFFDDFGQMSGVYIVGIQNTDRFKIGRTVNLKRRIKQFKTGNPENINIVYFVETRHFQSLEIHLHKIFSKERIGGEWFSLDEQKLEELEANLIFLQANAPNEFRFYNVKATSIQGRVY